MSELICSKCEGTGVSPLRRAIQAPPGHVIVVRDLSAIEARMNFWLAGQQDKVEAYRQGKDLYCEMYYTMTGTPITKKNKSERFLGKTVVLGCGYGLGWRKYQSMLRVGMLGDKGRILGEAIADPLGAELHGFKHKYMGYILESLPPGMDPDVHALHCACAERIIGLFRSNNPKVPEFWKACDEALGWIYNGEEKTFGPNGILKTSKTGIQLPNGMWIRYVGLEADRTRKKVNYSVLKDRRKGEREKIYGGKVDENIDQALSRIVITDAMLQMAKEGMRPVHQIHDEVLVVCREDEAADVYQRMGEIMSTPPSWAPDLPLASEGGWNRSYIK